MKGVLLTMARTENIKKYRKVSVWNWMGTLILMAIPGVNIIATILFLIFAKAQAKRSYAWANLILALVGTALFCAAFIIFGEQIASFIEFLRTNPVLNIIPAPV